MCQNFLLRLNNISLYIFHLSLHSSMDTWVASTFWPLWVMLLWTWVYRYVSERPCFSYFWVRYPHWNFLKDRHTIFHSSYTILRLHQQCTKVPISSYPGPHLLLSAFLIIAILMCMKWYLTVHFFTDSDVQHLFLCLLVICISFLGSLFKSFAHFLIGLYIFVVTAES